MASTVRGIGESIATRIVGKIFGLISMLFAIGFLLVGGMLSFLNYVYTNIVSAIVSFVNGITCSIPLVGCQGQNAANDITSSLKLPPSSTIAFDALIFLIIGFSFLIVAILLFLDLAVLFMVFVFVGLTAFVVILFTVIVPVPSILWQFLNHLGL